MDERLFALLLPLVFFLALGRPAEDRLQAEFAKKVSEIEKRLIPDNRVDLLETEAKPVAGRWAVRGETTVPAAREEISQAAAEVFGSHLAKAEIKLLPETSAGPVDGLVRVSVAPMRKVARHSAEMVDQVVMGTPVKILRAEPGWFLIQTPYRYLGWVEELMLTRVTAGDLAAWNNGSLGLFNEPFGTIWSNPDQANAVADIVLGCTVKTGRSDGTWTEIELPDHRHGFLPARALVSTSQSTTKADPKQVIALARRLFGIPYLWGGNSTKGFDCSGFTQTVFKMQNIVLPRDADQQAALGKPIEPKADFSNILPGDLLFFGKEHITHVAISLGGAEFIQASGDINIKSLEPKDIDFDAARASTLRQIRRVIE